MNGRRAAKSAIIGFKGKTYELPQVILAAAKLRRRGGKSGIRKAASILRLAIARWPRIRILYVQLIGCLRRIDQIALIVDRMRILGMKADPFVFESLIGTFGRMGDCDTAWRIFNEARRCGFSGNRHVHDAIMNALYANGRHEDILDWLDPANVPIDSMPCYCEALRKAKRYREAIERCDAIIGDRASGRWAKERAWIIKIHCLMHHDPNGLAKEIGSRTIGPSDPNHARYLSILVFSGLYDREKFGEIRETLMRYAMMKVNERATKDILHAIDLLV